MLLFITNYSDTRNFSIITFTIFLMKFDVSTHAFKRCVLLFYVQEGLDDDFMIIFDVYYFTLLNHGSAGLILLICVNLHKSL